MLQTYLAQINHNRYLKIHYLNLNQYSQIQACNFVIQFSTNFNQKFLIICIYFFFKTYCFKNSYYILVNTKNKQIYGIKFILTNQLLFKFITTSLLNFLNQPEIQNLIKLKAFDKNSNYHLTIQTSNLYFIERFVQNRFYKLALQNCKIHLILKFKNNLSLFDHMFFLNFFKFYFN